MMAIPRINHHLIVRSHWPRGYVARTRFQVAASECFRSCLQIFLYHCKMLLFSYPTASILLILSAVFGLTEACSSRSGSKIRPPHVARPPNVTYRTYPCPREPAERLCLNGGTCFTLFENSTDYFCKCAEGYCGATCGDKYTRNGCYSSFSSSSLVIMASSGIPRPPETFPCPPGPAEWLCLNGGTCFTVFENATDFACHCTEGYCGLNCGEKYTRYGCFSRYLVISSSAAGAGTLAVLLVVLLVVGCFYYHKRTPRSGEEDPHLKLYFERNVKMRLWNRSSGRLALTGGDSRPEQTTANQATHVSLDNYLHRHDVLSDNNVFNNYLNFIRLI